MKERAGAAGSGGIRLLDWWLERELMVRSKGRTGNPFPSQSDVILHWGSAERAFCHSFEAEGWAGH